MCNVILLSEDGEYILFSGSESQCISYCEQNEDNYGEGQTLIIE